LSLEVKWKIIYRGARETMYLNVEKREGEDVVNAEVICKIWSIELRE